MADSLKNLTTLIRVEKHKLDELRRKMNAYEMQKAQLLQAVDFLQKELEREIELAAEQADMGQFFGNFSERIAKRKDEIAKEVVRINKEILTLNQQILVHFSELKKFEVAKENLVRRTKEEANRKETQLLDEMGIQRFERREES